MCPFVPESIVYDVIVSGARCAGAPTAMLLARKGYQVLLVDRASFPSDVPRGHLIHRRGPHRLQSWGLLDPVLATGCPPITRLTTDYGDRALTGTELRSEGIPIGIGPRRQALDRILAEAAAAAGAELRTRFRVEEYLMESDRITGIRGQDREGRRVVEHGVLTVGADGRNSLLADTVDAPVYDQAPPLACWYFSYWSGMDDRGLELYIRGNSVSIAFPTNDGLTAVFVAWPMAALDQVRSDIGGPFMAAVDMVPELGERVRAGRREERFLGAADLPNFFRRPFGPGWALVGDAGYHKDPFLALGIADAFRDAELLAEAIDAGLSGRVPIEEAMAEYEGSRNQAAAADYRLNLELARFQPLPEELLAVRAAIEGDPEMTRRYYLALQGVIPRESFFNPENLERLVGRAA